MPVSFTRKGWIEVWQGQTWISRHSQEREAIEKVVNLILQADHEVEYEIRGVSIVAKGYGVLSPGTPGGDTQAPTTPGSLSATATSATTVRLTWTQSTDNVGVTGYQVFRNGTPIGTTTSLQYDDTGRSPSTQYSYTVTAYDAAGNNSEAAGPALATTNSNSAPVWSLGNRSYNNGSAVNISLDGVCADADGDTITYSLVSGTLPTGLALSGARNQTLSGTVTADGSYAFVLGASDGIAAVQNVSLTFTVSTPDTTAPNPPSAPTVVGATSSTITLSLPASAASDHASYTIQRSTDGTNYGNRATGITASTWQDTGLSASTTYWYRLLDVDTSGNVSAAGAAVSQQTSAVASGTNAARISTRLAGRSPHFSYTSYIPIDPVTSTEVIVTNATQFNQYSDAGSGGVRIIVNNSFSGTVRITRSNIDVVMSNGATITGNIELGGTSYAERIRWTGGNLIGQIVGIRHRDVFIDDLSAVGTVEHFFNAGWTGSANPGWERLTILNSTLRTTSANGGSGWALHISSTLRNSGLIIGNSKFIAGLYQTSRIQYTGNILIFDSVFNPDGAGNSGFRIHEECNNVWIRDTWARGGFNFNRTNDGDLGPCATNCLFDNFDRYANDSLYAYTAPLSIPNTGTIQNSTLYTSTGGVVASVANFTDGGGNAAGTWTPATIPDHSGVGAIR